MNLGLRPKPIFPETEAAGDCVHVDQQASPTRKALVSLCVSTGYQYASFRMARAFGSEFEFVFMRTTFPSDWFSHYLLSDLVLRDPVVARGFKTRASFAWGELRVASDDGGFWDSMERFALPVDGWSMPFVDVKGRCSLLSLCGVSTLDRDADNETCDFPPELATAARNIHETAILEIHGGADTTPSLSPRERECLLWMATGKTQGEIAIILNLSEHTIRGYIKQLRLKMGCNTIAEAVSKAIRLKII